MLSRLKKKYFQHGKGLRQPKHAYLKTWQLAWPVIIGNMAMPLLGITDAAILGHLPDSVYLAAVTVGLSIMAFVFFGFNFLPMGLSGFTSQALGRDNVAEVLGLLKRYAFIACCLILLFLAFHRLFIDLGLAAVKPSTAVDQEARLYLTIRMIGLPAIVFNTMLIGFFVGLQNTRIGLQTLALSQVANIFLNVMFVFGFGMATAGIAWGTVISEYLGLALILWHLKRYLSTVSPDTLTASSFSLSWSELKPIFQVSTHIFTRTFFLLSSFIWFNRMGAQFGVVVLAANGLLLQFFHFVSYFLDGTASAAEAQTGHAIGRKDSTLQTQVYVTTFMLTLLFMVFLAGFLFAFGSTLVDLLTNQTDVLSQASDNIWLVALLPITGGIAFWLDGVFIGARLTQHMRNSVLLGFFGFVLMSYGFAENNTQLWLCFNLLFVLRSSYLLAVFFKKLH